VLEVVEDSPASTAGLQEGDVIVAIDGEPVLSPGSLVDLVATRDPGDQVELTIYRLADGAKCDLQVTLGGALGLFLVLSPHATKRRLPSCEPQPV